MVCDNGLSLTTDCLLFTVPVHTDELVSLCWGHPAEDAICWLVYRSSWIFRTQSKAQSRTIDLSWRLLKYDSTALEELMLLWCDSKKAFLLQQETLWAKKERSLPRNSSKWRIAKLDGRKLVKYITILIRNFQVKSYTNHGYTHQHCSENQTITEIWAHIFYFVEFSKSIKLRERIRC